MTRSLPFALVAALQLAACSKNAGADAPGAGGPGGGGRAPSVTLAPADVASPRLVSLEDAVPVTGTLDPLDRAEVRAALEGDLDAVYVREGQPVSAGQVMARFRAVEQAGENASARADLASARTVLSTAQWNLDQTRDLYRQGAVPERDVRVGEQEVAAARARVAAANARLSTTARSVTDTRVVAPVNGIVEKRVVSPGEHVAKGASLFTVVRGDVLELAAAVPERVAAGVQPGQTVHFTAGARQIEGRVARVAPSVDPSSRSVTVYVQVPNGDGSLRAGTFASGRIVSRVVDNALVVPASALHEGKEGAKPFVYRITGDKIDVAEVTTGLADDAQGVVQVVDGLAPGDRVVVGNVGMLGKGMQVRMAGAAGRRGGAAGGAQGGR
ncbi:efflux RND transporter periplasmic adaptor subunit [Longimicrobium sp.]|uniref:efflux RND transporter periplasmic adaptor subunit n=1 Tax=Longimicrobium sp. TaxID=2029185 RepID=UPI002B62992A|nr:efflux RND transporter periplasmic adaptor subunit [Longimicrobium sp.]HSU12847.1 efflux RND transporter periplasmic adaptor subunit [Longimicrobium sp.]